MTPPVITVTIVWAGLSSVGCVLTPTEPPPFVGPSELALTLVLAATPDVLVQDGMSKALLTVAARDATSRPVADLAVAAHVDGDDTALDSGRLSRRTVTTDAAGMASLSYTAPRAGPGSGVGARVVSIVLTPIGTNFANAVPRTVLIRLVPQSAIP